MKLPRLPALLLLCSFAWAHASEKVSEIKLGYTVEQVIEALGKPMGSIEMSDKSRLLYPRGDVTLTDGLVSDFDLMDPAAYAAEQARLSREREEWLADQEKREAAREAEGRALRAERMQSQAFASLPAKHRVDFWRNFQARYPSIDVSEQIATALEGYKVELAELRSRERISELEARVARAEREAAAARLETEKLRKEAEQTRNSTRYGLRHYTYPVIPSPHYRPRTVTIFTNGQTRTTHQHLQNPHWQHWQQPNRHPVNRPGPIICPTTRINTQTVNRPGITGVIPRINTQP
ncbi:MAG: hypothetical protein EA353_08180 [Puniceicoccaceae bacterium]|nr:MAG: hypothetical protein EA353_08180 [Puniceicoccaceae bacterium]